MRSWSKCSNTAHEPACRYTPHPLLSSNVSYHMLKVSGTHMTRAGLVAGSADIEGTRGGKPGQRRAQILRGQRAASFLRMRAPQSVVHT